MSHDAEQEKGWCGEASANRRKVHFEDKSETAGRRMSGRASWSRMGRVEESMRSHARKKKRPWRNEGWQKCKSG